MKPNNKWTLAKQAFYEADPTTAGALLPSAASLTKVIQHARSQRNHRNGNIFTKQELGLLCLVAEKEAETTNNQAWKNELRNAVQKVKESL